MKIAIVGYGVEGRSNYRYYRAKYPNAEIVIFDERAQLDDTPEGAQLVLGSRAFAQVKGFDLVLRSPSVAPDRIKQADHHWSATREFLRQSPAPIIGVTGSKGKGTTCSLIASILRQHLADRPERHVHLLGNIGVPALDVLPSVGEDDIVVYELSSFQLWDCTHSPTIAVVTMIEPDHLNVHTDFADYLNAKKNIRRHQQLGDVCLYHPTNKYSQEVAAAPLDRLPDTGDNHGDTLDFAQRYAIPDDDQVYVQDGYFCVQNRQICSTNHLLLPGAHNLENACAAMSAVTELPINVTDEQFAAGLESFTGLPHRLKFIAEKNGVKYYDDSISTTPGSAIAALKAFTESKILILGGSDKGADYTELAQEIARQNMRVVIVNGANASEIIEILHKNEVSCQVVQLEMASMLAVVETAASQAQPGDVVILSPAAASFDVFKSYNDRGEQFVAAVEKL